MAALPRPARPLAAVVLAGGAGTRLWPLSRASRPKHLLPLGPGGRTLLWEAVDRVAPLADAVLVVTIATQAELVGRALADLAGVRLALLPEPVARGTGPALGWAAHEVVRTLGADAVIISAHADHLIPEVELARVVLATAATWASAADGLLAVGVTPSHPATGFGYIEVGPRLPAPAGLPRLPFDAHRGLRFLEKPQSETAASLLASGTWQWNTGLFAWPASRFLEELERAAPAVAKALRAAVDRRDDAQAFTAAYAQLPSIAVEPLVLERTTRLLTLTAPMRWSDLGSFADLYAAGRAVGAGDAAGNIVRGTGVALDSRGCFLDAGAGRLVAAVGCEDLTIIDAGDALLVCPRPRAQQVREVVEWLRQADREDLT